MKVYLASWFASQEDQRKRAEELRSNKIEVTSNWIDEKVEATVESHLRAQIDLEDILQSNYVVLNVPSAEDLKSTNIPIANWARGGRHFESGFQYATMMFFNWMPSPIQAIGKRGMILVGHKENVFHHLDGINKGLRAMGFSLPAIDLFETWEEAKQYLISASREDNKEKLWLVQS